MTTLGDRLLIGRTAHMALIEHVADALTNPTGDREREHVVVLSGEPGSGRSALLNFARRSVLRDWMVASISGHPAESELPYAALHQLCVGLKKSDRTGLVEQFEQRFLLAAPTSPLSLTHALLELLSALSAERPLAILVDDTHWVDPSSRQALTFVARRLDAEPVLVMYAGSNHAAPQIRGTDVVVELCPLNDADARMMVREVAPGIAASVLDQVVEWAAGLPLALVELAGQLSQAEREADVALPRLLPVGPALSSLFSSRVEALTDVEVTALYLACAERLDRPTMHAALDATGLSIEHLAASERAGLIRLDADVWTPKHPSVRSCVESHTTLSSRIAVHRALADLFHDDPERRAPHIAAAATGPDQDVSQVLTLAAEASLARGGLVEAAQFREAAARHCTSDSQALSHLEAAVSAYMQAGASAQALRVIERLLRGDCHSAQWAHWQSLRIACTLWARGDKPVGLEDVTRRATSLPDGQGFDVLIAACLAYFVTGRYRVARLMLDDAQALTIDEPRAHVLSILTDALDVVVGTEAAGHLIRGDWLAQVGDQTLTDPRFPANVIASVLGWLDATEACERIAQACGEVGTDDSVRTPARITTHPLLAMVAERRGQWSRAAALYAEAGQLALDSDNDTAYPFIALRHAYLAAARGDAVECEDQRSRALRHARAITPSLIHFDECVRGSLALATGDFEAAVIHLERARELEVSTGLACPGMTSRFADHFEALWRLGRHHELAAELKTFEQRATWAQQPTDLAVAARCHALLADPTDADELFERALQAHQRSPQVFETARTHLGWGMVLRRSRRKNDAIEQLTTAQRIFEQLDAGAWLELVHSELRACGQRRTTEEMQAGCPFAQLTPREFEVAEVVASGLTNPETASRLFVSERTVEFHLSNAYRKLQVQDRQQLTQLFKARPT